MPAQDIFVEHYQNCDDAGAREVFFLLDECTYSADKVVTSGAADLQGPALLFGSSQALTNEDLRRIQRLGASEKRGQFTTAGRFGLVRGLYGVTPCLYLRYRHFAHPLLAPTPTC